MRGWIVVYQLPPGVTQAKRVGFRQRFIGAVTTSHGGRYQSHRHGLLEQIPHRRLIPGVLLLEDAGRAEVEEFLRREGATYWVREIILTEEDRRFVQRPAAG